MKSYSDMTYHPMSEKLVEVLQTKTQNSNPLFFRVIVAYYLAMITSHMRVSIKGWAGKGTIPVNLYAIALSPSGSGKGHSTSLVENEVINNFKELFLNHTFPITAEQHCDQLSIKRANRNGTDANDELMKLAKDFQALGAMLLDFDNATVPAVKQMRQKLLMANAGSLNLRVDEIGANFSNIIEVLTAFLELYDKGLIKDKLVKSSADNTRFERIDGYTPANMLLFGTPSKLLDGARTEEQLMEMLEMGYARRCFFGFTDKNHKKTNVDVDELINQLFNNSDDDYLEDLSNDIGVLANLQNMNKVLHLTQDTIRLLVEYKLDCETRSNNLSELETIKKSELEHRYFKVLKLAGAYAFVDSSDYVLPEHIEYAIKLAEDSGEAFAQLMTPQRSYVKLANYLAQSKEEVTLADLDEDLPSFRGSKAQKDEQITMATAWGYKNNIIIKKNYVNSIMFLYADSIQETDLDKVIISYSKDMTQGYRNEIVPFDKLPELFKLNDRHWINHHLANGYRKEDNVIKSFNLLVLDVDGTISLKSARELLKKYKAIFYTTKSHTDEVNRFRIILPTSHTLDLDASDYKELYNNILKDIPFEVDTQCSHRSKKWLTHKDTTVIENDGELFDVLPYIPKSSKNDERIKRLESQQDFDNLERWVINNTGSGNRNNMLLRYALILADNDTSFSNIKNKVLELNSKLQDKLDELEIHSTIFHTIAGKLAESGKL